MHIRLINPNTTPAMTERMGACATRVAAPGTRIRAVQPADGPVSIEGHFDEALAAVGVLDEIRRGEEEGRNGGAGVDAYVIACFGDPGLLAARELTAAPVIGIAEAAFHLATLISTRFSVVTTLGRTVVIAEHLLRAYGFEHHCRKVRAAEIPVLDLEEDADGAFACIAAECRRARDEDGAGAIVLGCGGMADLVDRLRAETGIPVVEGVGAAVKLAEALHGLGLGTSKHGDLAFPRAKAYAGRFSYFGA
ncbi:aspartate/glutamate racemase family protein [Pseudothauera nasutitermitis]|uniref:Hydantoin racemase n=1 Tax=Pseudothauera nasutitermitis TaxID=2565930 RepID=A0A4S4B341_9RHOO|nr:aspartate/glutamate racemase family protein [Pseudothauera nasutitermitis]THF66605.1 aspartate/glutamate racemase family protein [Pseudothauera nasutitermitis]